MKTRSIFFSLIIAAIALTFLMNCNGKNDGATTESHEEHQAADSTARAPEANATEPQFQVGALFQQQLANVFTSYLQLKDAFVLSDVNQVKTEAKKMSDALDKVDMKLISGAAHNDWMNYLSPVQRSLKEIQASSDVEVQRKAFSSLSDNLYKSVKAFGLGGKEAFYEYCPMAFNNQGAYWLSDQEEIRNPYFGDKMPTCGSVIEKLK
jgi:Cu(I)/Ag(I) efflux system membrane fusion protein